MHYMNVCHLSRLLFLECVFILLKSFSQCKTYISLFQICESEHQLTKCTLCSCCLCRIKQLESELLATRAGMSNQEHLQSRIDEMHATLLEFLLDKRIFFEYHIHYYLRMVYTK